MAQCIGPRGWSAPVSGLALALATLGPARADGGYVGDLPIFTNSGAAVWTTPQTHPRLANPGGASILNQSQATAQVVDNAGVIRNAPGATWNGEIDLGANKPGAEIVNQGDWNGVLRNAGGGIDNSGMAAAVVNASGVFANEGVVAGALVNGGQAANNGSIGAPVRNTGVLVNNAAGSIKAGLSDSGRTTNNGLIAGGVAETGAFVNNGGGRVRDGFVLSGGSAVNNGEIDGGVSQYAGSFDNNGVVRGGARIAGDQATFTLNNRLEGGATVTAGSLVVNSAGQAQGDFANAGTLKNAGAIQGVVTTSGGFVNQGRVDGVVRQTGGDVANHGVIAGGAAFEAGGAVNNGSILGPVSIAAAATMTDNGRLGGGVSNAGTFVENSSGVVAGAFVNTGEATINGELAGGATNRGRLTINAAGRVAGGLVVDNGLVFNGGSIAGGASVRAGVLTSTGSIEGGLDVAGLVTATGAISGPVRVTGRLVVGDAPGATLTLAPGSTLSGAVAVPVDLATGKGAFLVAKGADVSAARLDLAGALANPKGAYWGTLSLSDAPIALSPAARAALAAASGPLYSYADSGQGGVTQTINPGLGATAGHVAAAAALAFAQAPSAPPEAAPEGVSLWAQGVATRLTVSGENNAGAGPAFGAARFSTRLAGAEAGLEYRISALRLGLEGGELAGRVADPLGSGALRLPFVGGYAGLNANGLSARVEARYLALDMRLTDAGLAVYNQSQRAAGFNYSAAASYRFPAGALYLEPDAGVSYTRLAVAEETTNVGALSFGRTQLALAHAGLRLGGDVPAGDWRLQPYVFGAVWRAWRRGTVEVPQGPTIAPTGLAGFEQVGLGVEASFARGLSLSARGEGLFGARVSGLAANAAVRLRF